MSRCIWRGIRCLWVVALMCASSAQAALVEYSLSDLGGDVWRYDYTLSNTGPALSFHEFTVYFDAPGITAISVLATPNGWDSLVVQPDLQLPDAGFFDSLSLSGAVPAGSNVSGFSVVFSYLAGLTPGAQRFELVVSDPFETVYSGLTAQAPSAVPLPAGFALMLGGLCTGALGLRRKPAALLVDGARS